MDNIDQDHLDVRPNIKCVLWFLICRQLAMCVVLGAILGCLS